MERVYLGIYTEDRTLAFDLLDTKSAGVGQKSEILPGTTLRCTDWNIQKSFGVPEFLGFVIDASVAIEVGLLTNWLYTKVCDKKIDKLIINRREVVEISRDSIRYALEETITKEKS